MRHTTTIHAKGNTESAPMCKVVYQANFRLHLRGSLFRWSFKRRPLHCIVVDCTHPFFNDLRRHLGSLLITRLDLSPLKLIVLYGKPLFYIGANLHVSCGETCGLFFSGTLSKNRIDHTYIVRWLTKLLESVFSTVVSYIRRCFLGAVP